MTGKTHMFVGAAVGALTTPAIHLMGMIVGGVAALMPDIDNRGSTMGRGYGRYRRPLVERSSTEPSHILLGSVS